MIEFWYLRCALLLKKYPLSDPHRIGCEERRSFPGAWNSGPVTNMCDICFKRHKGSRFHVERHARTMQVLQLNCLFGRIHMHFIFVQVFVGCWNSELFWCLCVCVWHLCQTLFTKFQNPAEVRTQARCDKSLKPRPVLQPRPVLVADSLWIIPLDSKADKLTKIEKDLEEVAVDMFAYFCKDYCFNTFRVRKSTLFQNARWKVL